MTTMCDILLCKPHHFSPRTGDSPPPPAAATSVRRQRHQCAQGRDATVCEGVVHHLGLDLPRSAPEPQPATQDLDE
jgi:hypothetical protein